MVNITALSEFH